MSALRHGSANTSHTASGLQRLKRRAAWAPARAVRPTCLAASLLMAMGAGHAKVFILPADGSTFSTQPAGMAPADTLLVRGTGAMTILGNFTHTGTLFVENGRVNIGNGGTVGAISNSTVELNSVGSILAFNRSDKLSFAGNIQGDGQLNIYGNGELTLTGFNGQLRGGAVLGRGTLVLGSGTALGSGNIRLEGGALRYTEVSASALARDYSYQFDRGDDQRYLVDTGGQRVSWGGDLSSPGGELSKFGAGTLVLSGANSYTGSTSVTAGNLLFAKRQSLYNGDTSQWRADKLSVSAGAVAAFAVGGSGEFTAADIDQLKLLSTPDFDPRGFQSGAFLGLDTSNASGGRFVYASNVADNAGKRLGLAKLGTGTLVLSGANSFSGGVQLQEGVLALGSAQALGTQGSISFLGGALQYSSVNALDYSDRFSRADKQQFKVDTNGRDVRWATGMVSAGGSLEKLGTGSLTLLEPTVLSGGTKIQAGTLIFAHSGFAELGGSLEGSGALQVNGSGQLTLSGASLLRGNTALNSGTLLYTNRTAFYDDDPSQWGKLSVAPGATLGLRVGSGGLDFSATQIDQVRSRVNAGAGLPNGAFLGLEVASGSYTFGNNLSGSNGQALGFAKLGGGTLVLSGSNNFAAGTELRAGGLELGSAQALGSQGSISFSGGMLRYTGSNAQDYSKRFSTAANQAFKVDTNGQNVSWASALVSEGGSLTKAGSGTLTLSGVNRYTGITDIQGGTLLFANTAGQTLAGSLVGKGNLGKSGSGNLVLAGDNRSFSGKVFLAEGSLELGSANALSSSLIYFRGGTLRYSSAYTQDNSQRFSATSYENGATAGFFLVDTNGQKISWARDFYGVGDSNPILGKYGAGTLTLTGSSYFFNVYLGEGTLNLGSGGAVSLGSQWTFAGGTLQYSDKNTQDYSSRLKRDASQNQQVRVDTNGQNVRWASELANQNGYTTSLTKLGEGTWTLWGANTYTGKTEVLGGRLLFGYRQALYNGDTSRWTAGNVRVGNGATAVFPVGGNGEFSASDLDRIKSLGFVTGSLLALDTSNASGGRFSYAGAIADLGGNKLALVKEGTGVLELSGNNSFSGGMTLKNGVLALGSAQALGTQGLISFEGGVLQHGSANAVDYSSRFSTAFGQQFKVDTGGRNIAWASSLASSGSSLVKQGMGQLQLLAPYNNFSAGVQLQAGVLALATDGALGSEGRISFEGGTLQFSAENTRDYSARFVNAGNQQYKLDTNNQVLNWANPLQNASGSLSKLGAGTLVLTNDVSLASSSIEEGALYIGNGGRSGRLSGAINLKSALIVNRSDTLSLNDSISGSGRLLQIGDGKLSLNKLDGAFTGQLEVLGGTLELNGASNGLVEASIYNQGQLLLNGTLALNGKVEGYGSIQLGTGSAVTFNGSNTINGPLVLGTGAALTLGNDRALGSQYGGSISFEQSSQLLLSSRGGFYYTSDRTTDYSYRFSKIANQIFSVHTGGNDVQWGADFSGAVANCGSSCGNKGQLLLADGGRLTLSGKNAFNQVSVQSSTLRIGNGSRAELTGGSVKLDGRSTLVLDRVGDFAYVLPEITAMSGSSSTLSKQGSGHASVAALRGTGSTVLNVQLLEGSLGAGTRSNLSRVSFNFAGGALSNKGFDNSGTPRTMADFDLSAYFSQSAGQRYRMDTAGIDVSWATSLNSAQASLQKEGAGLLSLLRSNSFEGGVLLRGGTLGLDAANAIGSQGEIDFQGGTLRYSAAYRQDDSARFSAADEQLYNVDTNGQDIVWRSGLNSLGGSLLKQGAGSLTLTGSNGFDGASKVAAGTLQIGDGGSSGSLVGDVILAAGSRLGFNRADALSFAGAIQGEGLLFKNGAGTLTLTGLSDHSGGTQINAGTLQIGGTGTELRVLQGAIVNQGQLSINRSGRVDVAGDLSGSGALNLLGSGTVALQGNNSFTGVVNLNGGVLELASTGALGGSSASLLNFNGGVLRYSANNSSDYSARFSKQGKQQFKVDTAQQNVRWAANLSSSNGASLTKMGEGVLSLSGSNNFANEVTLQGGVLALDSANALGSLGAIRFVGGSLRYSSANTQDISGRIAPVNNQQIKVDTNGQTVSWKTAITAAGNSVQKSGLGRLSLEGSLSSLGAVNIAEGELALSAQAGRVETYSAATSGSGTLVKTGQGQLNLRGTLGHTGKTQIEAGILDLSSNQALSFAGDIGGAGQLQKSGTGTLSLHGLVQHTGRTSIKQGALEVGQALAGSSLLSIERGASLLSSSSSSGRAVTIAASDIAMYGILSPGGSGLGEMNLALAPSGKLRLDTSSELRFNLGADQDLISFDRVGDWLTGSGKAKLVLNLGSADFDYGKTYTLFHNVSTADFSFKNISGYDSQLYTVKLLHQGGDYSLQFTAAAVPEPQTYALLLAGLALVAASVRRRTAAQRRGMLN